MPSFQAPGPAFTIANGQTVSNAQQVDPSMALVGLFIPAAFTGVAITFQASLDGVTFQAVTQASDGTAFTCVVAAAKAVQIPPAALCGWSWLKIVSGSAEGAARTVLSSVRIV